MSNFRDLLHFDQCWLIQVEVRVAYFSELIYKLEV